MKKFLILSAVAFYTATADQCTATGYYGRGAGVVPSTCPAGQEKNGALCYPTCKSGFYGVGPACWQNCPAGYRDDGAYCAKPSAYGRGGGYVIWDGDVCARDNPSTGCEQYGALWYPKCKANFHAAGCCICSPDCPSGMTDIGASCAKQSYGRGAGSPLICASGLENQSSLCYTPCKSTYSGNGPICYQNCPSGYEKCAGYDLCVDNITSNSQKA